jgi:hypothetical protein
MYIDDRVTDSKAKSDGNKKRRFRKRTTKARIPFLRVTKDGGFQQKREFTDYLEIRGTHVEQLHPSEQVVAMTNFAFFLRKQKGDLKFIFMPFPADTQNQIDYMSYKIQQNPNSAWYPYQSDRRRDLHKIRESRKHQEFYLQFFAESEEALAEMRASLLDYQYAFFEMVSLPVEKKIKILFKLNNMNSEYVTPTVPDEKEWGQEVDEDGTDEALIRLIQPQGNLAFSERYIRKGDGYETCLEIYGYPRENGPFWGSHVFNQIGVITTVDVRDITKDKLLRALNNSIDEQERRFQEARNEAQKRTAQAEYQSLQQLLTDIIYGNETAKEMVTRLYLYAPTLSELNQKTKAVQSQLSSKGYQVAAFLSELEAQWEALFTSYKRQNIKLKRRGQEIKTFSLAASYPFNFSHLLDERGLYVGHTETKGVVLLDLFTKNAIRKSYNFLIVGTMGSGKSETIKKLGGHNTISGNYTYVFSVSQEYKRQAKALGGLHLDLNGREGSVNPLQVFATEIIDENSLVVDELGSFKSFISAKKVEFRFYHNGTEGDTADLEAEYEVRLREFFEIWCEEHQMSLDQITQYENDQYPILSDFLAYLIDVYYADQEQKIVNPHLTMHEQKRFDRIILTLRTITQNYGDIFNQHTSIPPLEGVHHCVFNMEGLLKQSQNIFNAQFFNMLNMVWDQAIRRGQREKYQYDRQQTSFWDIVYSLIIIDEFHNITKMNNAVAMMLLDRLAREGRKYFLGIGLATQNFYDVLPQQITTDVDKYMQNLFNITTYKFIMNQDPESVSAIDEAFRGQFSQAELERIPHLTVGKTILGITGYGNLHFKFDISTRERAIFDGGA